MYYPMKKDPGIPGEYRSEFGGMRHDVVAARDPWGTGKPLRSHDSQARLLPVNYSEEWDNEWYDQRGAKRRGIAGRDLAAQVDS